MDGIMPLQSPPSPFTMNGEPGGPVPGSGGGAFVSP